jgi:thymidine kinase
MLTQGRQLEVITGCMFSGKTEELIRRLERVRIARGSILLFKPTIDDRYSTTSVMTHYGREFAAHLLAPGEETMDALERAVGREAIEEATVVAFDEGNFFSDLLPSLCEELVLSGKRVIVAGLDLTFAGEPFGPMPTLLALADRVEKLEAVCVKCGGPATRSQRLVDGRPASANGPVIQVGGLGSYEARCRNCYER